MIQELAAPYKSEGLWLTCLRHHLSEKVNQSVIARLWQLCLMQPLLAISSILRCYGYKCIALSLKARDANVDTATPAIARLAC